AVACIAVAVRKMAGAACAVAPPGDEAAPRRTAPRVSLLGWSKIHSSMTQRGQALKSHSPRD
ncbi:MAG: hypothetical protein WBX78_11875, partial [Pseudolabrys sp.]